MLNRDEAMNALKALQITEPTSAWDVFERVIALVSEEPRRLRMSDWGTVVAGNTLYDEDLYPPCGTIGCWAGWSNVVITGHIQTLSPAGVTAALLGDDADLRQDLYDLFTAWILTNDHHQGSREHAAKVITAFTEFMRRNETFLRSHVVNPITTLEGARIMEDTMMRPGDRVADDDDDEDDDDLDDQDPVNDDE